MQRLQGITKNYAWGSANLLADLRSEPLSNEPEAEIWYGAHPAGPSTLPDDTTLLSHFDDDAETLLGQPSVERFGPGLPFLLKLLAANRPLSIQVHPSIEQAKRGFAAEDAAGIDRDAPERSFGDPNHKPELIAAITPFEALVGFRPIEQTVAMLSALGAAPRFVDTLAMKGYIAAVEHLLNPADDAGKADAVAAVASIVDGANVYDDEPWANEADLLTRLSIIYPGDLGIGVAALLNRVLLQPGEAIFLDAGNMHAYVGGLGVEIMANCDNVVRGGLTSKHIDVPALLDIVRPEPLEPVPVATNAGRYDSPAPEFALTRIRPEKVYAIDGPSIVIGTHGKTLVCAGGETIELAPTEAAWIAANERATVSTSALGFAAEVGRY